jgi:hypothetical protein
MAWSNEQLSNAKVIIKVGHQLGASQRDILVALMAAMQESSLRNLNYGDRDSIGLFQQRNGWGSKAARLDPYQSAKMFFLGGAQGQRGLLDFKNRDQWSLSQAAQAVQVSAFPDAYAKHESAARQLLGLAPSQGGSDSSTIQVQANTDLVTIEPPASSDMGSLQPTGLEAPEVTGLETPDQTGIGPGDEPFSLPKLSQQEFNDLLGRKTTSAGTQGGGSGLRSKIVQEALKYLGVPYAWGGNGPSQFDCSGLVKYVFGKYGIDLPRVSFQQANYGKRIGVGQAQAGDLIAWDNSTRNNGADHIAIYLGNGWIVEAPRPGKNVQKRRLGKNEGDYWAVSIL